MKIIQLYEEARGINIFYPRKEEDFVSLFFFFSPDIHSFELRVDNYRTFLNKINGVLLNIDLEELMTRDVYSRLKRYGISRIGTTFIMDLKKFSVGREYKREDFSRKHFLSEENTILLQRGFRVCNDSKKFDCEKLFILTKDLLRIKKIEKTFKGENILNYNLETLQSFLLENDLKDDDVYAMAFLTQFLYMENAVLNPVDFLSDNDSFGKNGVLFSLWLSLLSVRNSEDNLFEYLNADEVRSFFIQRIKEDFPCARYLKKDSDRIFIADGYGQLIYVFNEFWMKKILKIVFKNSQQITL